MLTIQYLCDDRVPQSIYEECQSVAIDECYFHAMEQSIDGTGICFSVEEMEADNDFSNTSPCACDR